MMIAMGATFSAAQVTIPTIAFCNVAPNPCGVGQQVTVNFLLVVPIPGGELAKI